MSHFVLNDDQTLPQRRAASAPAQHRQNSVLSDRILLAWCILAVVLSVLATVPVLEMGVNDDWSYTLTARALAQTGHLVYNGWATAMIGAQAYWAALWIRLFGFSFTLVRLTTLPFAAGCAGLLYALGRRCSLAPPLAAFGSLTVTLSPVFTPLAASFMSDVPGFFFLLACLYCADRAMETQKDKRLTAPIGWMALLVLSGLLGGTIRQVDWIAPAVFLPYLAWLQRDKRRFVATSALLWIVNLAGALWCMHWYKQQPYAIVERPTEGVQDYLRHLPWSLFTLKPLILTALMFTLPVLIGAVPAWRPLARKQPLLFWLLVVASVAEPLIHRRGAALGPWMGNIVTPYGIIGPWVTSFGDLPVTLPKMVRLALSAATYGMVGVFLAAAIQYCREWKQTHGVRQQSEPLPLILRLWLLYTLCYLPLLSLRMSTPSGAFDRYLLFLLPVIIIPALRCYQQNVSSRMNVGGFLLLAVFALYGIATTHDYLASERARLAAASELTAAGIPRTHIMAGLEYDGWTQIEQTGYFNDPRITNPPGAYHPRTQGQWPFSHSYFTDETKSIVYDYFVVLSTQPALARTPFPPVQYTAWMPPFHRQVIIQRVAPKM